jgi:hypothetical protein
LAIEKFSQLTVAPRSAYELYQSILRQPDPPVKQIGVPLEIEKRDMEVNTEEILFADKEMQFCNGDDTALYNIINRIKSKKKSDKNDHSDLSLEFAHSNSINVLSTDIGESFESNMKGAERLSSFLQRSTQLFECDLAATDDAKEDKKDFSESKNSKSNVKNDIFSAGSSFITLGGDKNNGSNELILTRNTISVRFSHLNSNLFVSAHQYPLEDSPEFETDLKPFKVHIFNYRQKNVYKAFKGNILCLGCKFSWWSVLCFRSIRSTYNLLFFQCSASFYYGWYSRRLNSFVGSS